MAKKQVHQPPLWEWIAAGIGLILVSAAIATAIYRGATEEATIPAITMALGSVTRTEGGYVVEYTVTNSSTQTAAKLTVEGRLLKAGQTVETSTATHSYAPANSTRKGGLIFTRDPAQYEVSIRPTGYETP